MNPTKILRDVAADGVNLSLTHAGTIKVAGDQAAVARWAPVIREHRPSVLAALNEATRLVPVPIPDIGGIDEVAPERATERAIGPAVLMAQPDTERLKD